jgi:hypothetical protein
MEGYPQQARKAKTDVDKIGAEGQKTRDLGHVAKKKMQKHP